MSESKKSKMSEEEERKRRRAAVGRAASEKISKSEQVNFRIEEQSISELQDMAFSKGMPLGTMIRVWVLERLAEEKLGTPNLNGQALQVLDEFHEKLKCLFDDHHIKAQNKPKGKPYSQNQIVSEQVNSIPISKELRTLNKQRLQYFKTWENQLIAQLELVRQQRKDTEHIPM